MFHSERGRVKFSDGSQLIGPMEAKLVLHECICYNCGIIFTSKIMVETQTCAHTLKIESVF